MAREAGLDTAALLYMNISDVIDYVAQWVNDHEKARADAEAKQQTGREPEPRGATQADIDIFLGRKTE